MDLQLTDQVAFVAGSSRGIGRAIALTLLAEGCRVCITGRTGIALDEATQGLSAQFGHKVFGIPGDLTDRSVIDDALAAVSRKWGGPDILIANVGSGRGKPGWQQEQIEWERLFNLNFFGSVRLAQAAIPYLKRRGGSILFMASIVAVEATPAPLPYSAAKAALVNYSKNHLKARREEVESYISTEVPQKRFGTPEEIAKFAAYLVSPNSKFATGGCYIMDGGQTRRV
jgi:3-oxoacyl-[acyl-carrier protein] reductase